MKKIILSILLGINALCPVISSFAQTQELSNEKKSVIHVSLVPPLSTNGIRAGEYTNSFSINLLAGISKNEKAFSLGGLVNIIKHNSSGFQLAGLSNYVGNRGNGFLFSGLTNIVRKDYSGLQLSGLMNVSGNIKGAQISGLINIAENVSGVQFAGLINVAKKSDCPIGLINIIKEGEMGITADYNEIGTTAITFRSGGKITYGIIGLGYNHKAKGDAYVVRGGFGAHINVAPWFRINNELTGESVNSFSNETTFKVGYSLLPAFKIDHHIEFFAGPSINYMQTDNADNRKIFPGNSLWKKNSSSKLQQLYIGYNIGIQYIF